VVFGRIYFCGSEAVGVGGVNVSSVNRFSVWQVDLTQFLIKLGMGGDPGSGIFIPEINFNQGQADDQGESGG